MLLRLFLKKAYKDIFFYVFNYLQVAFGCIYYNKNELKGWRFIKTMGIFCLSQHSLLLCSTWMSPDEEQRQRNDAYSKISEKIKGEETVTDKTLFKCSFCSFASYFKASYTLHSKKHHKTDENKDLFLMCKKRKNVYTCTVCKKSFNSSGNMFRHMKLHRNASLYQCMVCKVNLDSSETLKNHIADVHMDSLKFVKREKFVCKLCPEKFRNQNLFNEHCKFHNQLTCILCNLVCDDELALSTHLKLHEQKSSQYLQCTKCNFIASEKRSFIKHIRNHNDHKISSVEVKQEPKEKIETKKVTCMFCDKEFSGNLDLANHLSAIHSNISSTYKPESNNKETRILKQKNLNI
ncbi:Fez family zinc finger protein 2 [Armadillidium nasatum]|uniref:Fez family zinc finger protein 2 n=1 Tax=Armadillidium nasatum TaxID=96803 RepID=A0A5N5SV89_9CRUS|nr:Fez family zinc finger protein 2 [Armadillidium nasatum]